MEKSVFETVQKGSVSLGTLDSRITQTITSLGSWEAGG